MKFVYDKDIVIITKTGRADRRSNLHPLRVLATPSPCGLPSRVLLKLRLLLWLVAVWAVWVRVCPLSFVPAPAHRGASP